MTSGRRLIGAGPVLQQFRWMGEDTGIALAVDGFSLFMLMAIALVTLCVGLYSINYMEHYGSKSTYYALLLMMMTGMNGLVLAADLFQVYLFLEVAAIASYALVAYGLEYDELEASFKYLMLSVVASAAVLIAIAIIFGMTGSVGFAAVAEGLRGLDSRVAVGFCSALFIMGFGLKAALVPFHAWLPDAHPSAPAPISAILSGLLIKVSGVYALTRIFFNVFGLTPALSEVLMWTGMVSIVVAAMLAVGQTDMKRMLAYSSISQVGYVVLGIGLGTPLGIAGGLFHLFNHAVAKGLLFLNSGAVQQATGTRELDQMGGLAKRMPLTAGTSLVGSLSITGVPPLAGFWSKLLIIMALVQARQSDARRAGRPGQRRHALVLPHPPAQSLLRKARGAVEKRQGSAVLDVGRDRHPGPGRHRGRASDSRRSIRTWIQPAADALSRGVQAALSTGGF